MASVVSQNYKDIECVLVDDCSPDDSIAICEHLIEAYEGSVTFTILHHEKNRGLSAARNTGINAATGDYILFLDGDDELTSDCIEKLAKPVLSDPSIEMVMGNFERRADGQEVSSMERKTLELSEEDISSNASVRDYYFAGKLWQAAWNKLIKRDFLLKNKLFFKEGLIWEDTLWTFYVAKYLSHLYTIPEVTYYYYKRPNALTTGMIDTEDKRLHFCKVYDEIADHFTEGERGREARLHFKGFCFRCISMSDNQKFQAVSKKFLRVFKGQHLLLDGMLLSVVTMMSKYRFGQRCFHLIAAKRRPKHNGFFY